MNPEIEARLMKVNVEHLHHMDAVQVTLQLHILGDWLLEAGIRAEELEGALRMLGKPFAEYGIKGVPVKLKTTTEAIEVSGDFGSW